MDGMDGCNKMGAEPCIATDLISAHLISDVTFKDHSD